ncbi:methionine adenosyltransferase [Halobacteriota archaeon]
MKRNIRVEQLTQTPIETTRIELVERKGIGHPDSICDGIGEAVSRELSNEYLSRFGRILHHNTDQVELVGGEANPLYGDGEVMKPIFILIGGRATSYVGDEKIPVGVIAHKTAREYLEKNIKNLEPHHVVFDQRIGQGSVDLINVFERGKVPNSNDTSFGVGHAPFSETELVVYNTERAIMNLRKKMPAIGEDIKVMGLRIKDQITLTVANAIVSKYVNDLEHYKMVKEEVGNHVLDIARQYTQRDVSVAVNIADDYGAGSVYLTVTGTSAEMGDDGSVGRGNRSNGLITLNRPMSLEATSGKNPVSHVGKIYNLLSTQIAQDISEVEGVGEVYVRILSQIGQPIDNPKIVNAQIIPTKEVTMEKINLKAEVIIDDWLSDIKKITDMVVRGELSTF